MPIPGNQIKTLNLQISYDTKLNNATYDAIRAFQLNTINSGSSDLANSKLRDIEASANTFFNSIASNFNMAGYNKEILSEYVPALVYTMYDGYYIYSTYTNTLDKTEQHIDNNDPNNLVSDADILDANNPNATYKEGDRLSGLKPYIFYSCRYKRGNDDFVITYSMDNYITIQGTIDNQPVFDSGYLLSNLEQIPGGGFKYRGIQIDSEEELSEYIWDPDPDDEGIKKYNYIKVNGVKYYYDKSKYAENGGYECFTILNGEKLKMRDGIQPNNNVALTYYKEAYDFTRRVLEEYDLRNLTGEQAINETTNGPLLELDEEGNERAGVHKLGNYPIFSGTLEDPNSNFNQQRLAVIRYSIEKNLSIAIANYNNVSGANASFQMPKLKEDEWEKIINNVSIISFLQGLNIGGKVYNGYSIITNNKNEEVVNEDSIYIVDEQEQQYYKANDRNINNSHNIKGVFNIDLEKKSVTASDSAVRYVIPQRR